MLKTYLHGKFNTWREFNSKKITLNKKIVIFCWILPVEIARLESDLTILKVALP